MTADRPVTEPRTEAGRETLRWFTRFFDWGADEMLLDILAIEAEAAQVWKDHAKMWERRAADELIRAEAAQGAAPRAEGPQDCRDGHDERMTMDFDGEPIRCIRCKAPSEGAAPLRQQMDAWASRLDARFTRANDGDGCWNCGCPAAEYVRWPSEQAAQGAAPAHAHDPDICNLCYGIVEEAMRE